MIKLDESQLEELKQIVEKWNNGTISLEELGRLLLAIDGKASVRRLYNERGFLEKLKKIIDTKRVENINGQSIEWPLKLEVSDSGRLLLKAFGSKGCLCCVSGVAMRKHKFMQSYGISINCFNGEQISVRNDLDYFVVINSNYSDKGELMTEILETVGYDGRTLSIEEYYPLEAGKPIDGYDGYMLAKVVLKEPDRVWKVVGRFEGQFPKCVDRTAWIGNKDLRSGLGTLDLRDLPRPDEAGWIRMAAEEGKLVVENEKLINECIVDLNYYDEDTLSQALLKVDDEELRDSYRQLFDRRRKKQEEETKLARL